MQVSEVWGKFKWLHHRFLAMSCELTSCVPSASQDLESQGYDCGKIPEKEDDVIKSILNDADVCPNHNRNDYTSVATYWKPYYLKSNRRKLPAVPAPQPTFNRCT